ncbi:hypothetical protein DY000_02010476 [Brassica cretica]|uniref:RING-type E3 ubiquitin transferase n=1 Tax=Brassica cretica TaxID=69181 RepID=A0ABQ7C739_BRACR|nr:hypothetical protein DY000_02010476 [Brassica cretica]
MRPDVEEMSYEELLALSKRIGTINTGLPEEDVKNHLKTRTCSGTSLAQTKDRETEPCTICQESFKKEEKIARLDCGHQYLAECLEKLLIVKNVYPIRKADALVIEKINFLNTSEVIDRSVAWSVDQGRWSWMEKKALEETTVASLLFKQQNLTHWPRCLQVVVTTVTII